MLPVRTAQSLDQQTGERVPAARGTHPWFGNNLENFTPLEQMSNNILCHAITTVRAFGASDRQ